MASTSIRFVTQSSKLVHGHAFSFPTRPINIQFNNSASRLPKRFSISVLPCTTSRQAFRTAGQQYSTRVSPCTIEFAQQLTSLARWTSPRPTKLFTKPSTRLHSSTQIRFASNQASQPGEKSKEESSLLSKIPAPDILKQTLTPHENIYTLPNLLTFTRLLSAPAIGYFILTSQPVLALSLFFYAGLTDLVDGWLARRFHSQTVVGTILDPMADKTLMTVAVVSLGIQGFIPVWLAVVILGRDVGLAISACYYRYISLPPPKTFTRYWDFSLPSAEVRPTEISKINTLLQLLLIGNAMALPVLPAAVVDAWNLVGVFEGWSFLVAGTTVWSGLSYVFSNDAVKILSEEEGKKREREMKEKKGEGDGREGIVE